MSVLSFNMSYEASQLREMLRQMRLQLDDALDLVSRMDPSTLVLQGTEVQGTEVQVTEVQVTQVQVTGGIDVKRYRAVMINY